MKSVEKASLLAFSFTLLFLGPGPAVFAQLADDLREPDLAGQDTLAPRDKSSDDVRYLRTKMDDLERKVDMMGEDMRYLRDKVRDLERSVDNARSSSRI